ncbi:inverse autotransporter beta domain-containing protein, partial [Nocardiopsis flavescens]|uniref:inverse autotransporter beta domain-containing protein n=1 Tax=Nocardiopsis flavescens TaxID=758803 RepID=UPI0036D845DC
VSLGVDEDFSLKSSSFEFLHPWYETPDNLVFSQHTLHRPAVAVGSHRTGGRVSGARGPDGPVSRVRRPRSRWRRR